MKKISIFCLLSICCYTWAVPPVAAVPSRDEFALPLGTTQKEFKKIYPEAEFNKFSQWQAPESVHDLKGLWTFFMKENRLESYFFDSYLQGDQINQANFDQCLKSTKEVIADLTAAFGKPTAQKEGITNFLYSQKNDLSYDVMTAEWDLANKYIRVSFKYHGGKSHYFIAKYDFSKQ